MYKYVWETPEEVIIVVAEHTKKLRKRLKISRQKLSELSGVSYGSIKRFEETGNISLLSLTKIAKALDVTEDIKNIFAEVPYNSIQEVINEQK
ncbi:MAG: helix-turn-helix transcriptional regulator [Lachnospiraceae bacterium]|nr:helix-turn-helix transcriptional regulator [Lachnospiraceae bacterium]